MSGRKKHEEQLEDELEITAQPSSIDDELSSRANSRDVGLSVDPDDLGRTFLSEATEQGNFESEYDETVDLYAQSSARSDEALTSANFEADHDVWENTVNETLQNGGSGHGSLVDDRADGLRFLDEGDDENTQSDDIDLTENAVQDASLMDREGEEYGETKSPEVTTDDAHTHAKKRGGHKPRNTASKPTSTSRGR